MHKYDFLEYAVLIVLFVIFPCLMLYFGLNMTLILGFVIGVGSLLSDGFLTKVGLKLGCKELNLTFLIFSRKIGGDNMILFSRLVGIGVLLLVAASANVALLLLFDISFLACVVGNSITLLSIVSAYHKRERNVD